MSDPREELDARLARVLADLEEVKLALTEFMEAADKVAALIVDPDLEAERVTRSHETHDELTRRLSKEGRQK